METLEQIKADAVEVFCYDREVRPQDRVHAYLGKYRVRRGYNDTAMQVAVTDMIERAYEAGRAEVAGANLVQNLRRQLTSIEATVGDAIDLLDDSTGAVECDEWLEGRRLPDGGDRRRHRAPLRRGLRA